MIFSLSCLQCSMRRYQSYSYRLGRSASPEGVERTFSDHVNNLLHHSRANSEARHCQMRSLDSGGVVTDLRYASLLCSPHSPWSKTGAFYWPRYPEAWRGTASCSSPRGREFNYWTSPTRYYRSVVVRW